MSTNARTRAFFDRWSRTYDNPLLQAMTYRPVQNAVVRAIMRQRPTQLLDVGCGTGQLTRRLADELAATVIGCDYSTGMLEEAAQRGGRPTWVRGDATALPFSDEAVDAIVSTESFHWYPDQPEALREFARVLRPSGRAYVALINPAGPALTTWTAQWSRLIGRPLRWPTTGQMRAMAGDAGFTVVAQQRVARVPMSLLLPAVLNIFERR